MAVAVTTAAQSARADAATIAAGTPSFALMQRAAAAIVAHLVSVLPSLWPPIALYVGSGNNGGDGWLVAAGLRAHGGTVRLHAVAAPRTPDATAAQAEALASGPFDTPRGDEGIVIDALLGTGQRVPLAPEMAACTAQLLAAAARGAMVIAIDQPTGVADRGDGMADLDPQAVVASRTVCVGSCKRVLLDARAHAGVITVLDIGLGPALARDTETARLVDATTVMAWLPPMPVAAHKGTRGRLALIGGAEGMVGAIILSARAALASGIGLVRCFVTPSHVSTVHGAVPEALVEPWPDDAHAFDTRVAQWASAIAIGPGLGRTTTAATLVARAWRTSCPLVVDADALAALQPPHPSGAGDDAVSRSMDAGTFAPRLAPTLLTPHPGEAATLLTRAGGDAVEARMVDRTRDQAARTLVGAYGATVLLKGVPTVLDDGHARWLVARGTAALATGGSGDLLTGIAGSLLAQGMSALTAGGSAAFVHGVAAETATAHIGGVRGTTLADVLQALPTSWPRHPDHLTPPLLAVLPAPPA